MTITGRAPSSRPGRTEIVKLRHGGGRNSGAHQHSRFARPNGLAALDAAPDDPLDQLDHALAETPGGRDQQRGASSPAAAAAAANCFHHQEERKHG